MSLLVCIIGGLSACSKDDDNNNEGTNDVAQIVLGRWTVTMSDPSWKVTLTLKEDGTYTEVVYYDIDGDKSFSEYDGTYNGTYTVSQNGITFNSSDDESALVGSYKWVSVSSSSFEASDGDGFYIYGRKN